jgi:hypothetical protein
LFASVPLDRPETQTSIPVDDDTRIQVLDSITYLPRADKEQRGAFIRDERTLVVWADSFDEIVPAYDEFEEKLTKMVWRKRPIFRAQSSMISSTGSFIDEKTGSSLGLTGFPTEIKEAIPEETEVDPRIAKAEKRKKGNSFWSWKLAEDKQADNEADPEAVIGAKRPTRLYAPIYSGLAVGLSICEWKDSSTNLDFVNFFSSLHRIRHCASASRIPA